MAISKFTLENGLQVTGSSNFSGSVSSSGGFTGSLFGTASYGQDSNLLDGLDSTAFARLASANIFTQTQTVSGNLYVTGTVSASVVTASQSFVSGGLTIGNYVQLLPVGAINIPANLSASYIYTSGSTNDMYFTQYQGAFTNTTRLRWLESTLSTGLLHGGIISTVNGTTAFSVTSGSGLIINYNASTDSDPYPTINFVSWPTYTSQSLLYSGSAQITYIAIASDGTISQETLPPNFSEFKDRIVLGRVLHQSGSVANGAINTPSTAYGLAANTADFIRVIGPLKISGHYLAPSGSGNLSLTKSAGDSYVEGRNYSLNPNIPNIVLAANDPAVTVSKIYRQFMSGGNPRIDTGVAGAGYTTVNPSQYQDSNGNLASVGTDFSVQRVYWFPRSVNKALFVYYGQATYANMDDAIAGINTENFVEGDNTKGSAILVAHLVMKGNISNFNSTTTSRIYQAGLFRGGAGGGGGGGVSGGATNLASLTDVSLGTPANGQALVYNTSISKWAEGYPNSASYATNAATASYIATGSAIATFTNDVRNQFSAGSNIGISDGVVSLSASVSTTAVTGTTGVSGALGLFPILTGSSISGTTAQFTTISGSNISGALIGTLNTISAVRAGTNLTQSDALTVRTINLTSSITTGLTLLTSTTGNFTVLSGTTTTGSTALFTTVTGTTTTGSTATFTTITGSTITGSTLLVNVVTGTTTTGSIATFTTITGSTITGSTSLYTVVTGTTTTGSTATFTTITGSTITGSTLSYTTLNTTQMTSSGKILVDNNVTIGNGNNRTGTDIGIGVGALNSTNASSNYNLAIGPNALASNTSGTQNTAIGFQALNTNIGGGSNIAIGVNALYSNKSGPNTAIGNSAGYSNTTDNGNVFIGYFAGRDSQASYNVSIGDYAGQNLKSGQNVSIGHSALRYHQGSVGDNFALGTSNMGSLISGSKNLSIGTLTMGGVVNGEGNLVLGSNAMYPLALGYNTVTASYNTALGFGSLGVMLTGTENVSIGYNSTANLQTGSYNSAIGTAVLGTLKTGSSNTVVGYKSLSFLQTGSNNVVIGNNAGSSILTGSGNVIIGSATGINNTDNNIYISDGAGNLRLRVDSNGALSGTVITGSSITGSTVLATVVTGTTTTGSTALFGVVTGSNINTNWIQFPASQVASSDVNTLDDYEEGFWIPAFSASTTTNFTYDTAATSGSYVKIGKNVSLNGYIKISSTGSSAGNLYIQSLPFAIPAGAVNYYSLNVGYHANLSATVAAPEGYGALGSSVIFLGKNTLGTATTMTVTDLTNTAAIMFSINYNVS
jgi:hypothetical protein